MADPELEKLRNELVEEDTKLGAVTNTANKLLKKLEGVYERVAARLTPATTAENEDEEDDEDAEDAIEKDEVELHGLPPEERKLLTDMNVCEKATEKYENDKKAAIERAKPIPDKDDRHKYKGFYKNLETVVKSPPTFLNMAVKQTSAPVYRLPIKGGHGNAMEEAAAVETMDVEQQAVVGGDNIANSLVGNEIVEFKDVYADDLKKVLEVKRQWEKGAIPKDKPETLIHPITECWMSELMINCMPFAQLYVLLYCCGYFSPVPASCGHDSTSPEDILFIWLFHYPPICCLQLLLELLDDDSGVYKSYVFAWYQHVSDYLEKVEVCPEGSKGFVNKCVVFWDWLPVPGDNTKGGSHVLKRHKRVILGLVTDMLQLMVTDWCPNVMSIRSHGRMPEVYHLTHLTTMLRKVAEEKNDQSFMFLAEEGRFSHPESLWWGWKKRVKMQTKRRNLTGHSKDQVLAYNYNDNSTQPGPQTLQTLFQDLPNLLSRQIIDTVVGLSNQLHYHYMAKQGKKRGGGGTAETAAHARLFIEDIEASVAHARASIDPVAQASRARLLKPKQLTGDEQRDSKVQRTLHVVASEAFKQSEVSDKHILLNAGSGAHFSWVVCHVPTRTHILALKNVHNTALEDDRKPELTRAIETMQKDGYTFSTITLEESSEKNIAQRSISNIQLTPITDFAKLREKVDGVVYRLCPADDCTTSVTPQSANGRYCSKHQEGIDETKEEEYKRRVLESGKVDGKFVLFSPDLYKARNSNFDWANHHAITKEKIDGIVDAYNSAEVGVKPQSMKEYIDKLVQEDYKFVLVCTRGAKGSKSAEVVLHEYSDMEEIYDKILYQRIRAPQHKRKREEKKQASKGSTSSSESESE